MLKMHWHSLFCRSVDRDRSTLWMRPILALRQVLLTSLLVQSGMDIAAAAPSPPVDVLARTQSAAALADTQPAFWRHPQTVEQSRYYAIVGGDALEAYSSTGQRVARWSLPQATAVAVVYGANELGHDLVAVADRQQRLRLMLAGRDEPVELTSLSLPRPAQLLCFHHDLISLQWQLVTVDAAGGVDQFQLQRSASGAVTAQLLRSFELGRPAGGCSSDPQLGYLYFSTRGEGIWRYDAQASLPPSPQRIDIAGGSSGLIDPAGLYYLPSADLPVLLVADPAQSRVLIYADADLAYYGAAAIDGVDSAGLLQGGNVGADSAQLMVGAAGDSRGLAMVDANSLLVRAGVTVQRWRSERAAAGAALP